MSGVPGHRGTAHWAHKRWQSFSQSRGEKSGTRVGTAFADEFVDMKKACMLCSCSWHVCSLSR